MKKQFLLLYTAFIVSFGFGINIDYGATVDSYVGGNLSDDSSVFGFEKVSLYSSFEFTDDLSLAIDGFYKFAYNSASDPDQPHTFDFSTLVFTMPIGDMNMMLGRNTISDYSGDILSHTLDGVSLTIPLSFGSLLVNAAYSGLVNSNEVSLFTTADDGDWIQRVIEGADLVISMETMDVWASIYSQQDLSDDLDNIGNNLSLYGGAGAKGSLGSSIFYSVRGNGQFGTFFYLDSTTLEDSSSMTLAGMLAATLTWYISGESELLNRLSPYASLDFGISSGDSSLSSASLGTEQPSDINDLVTLYTPLTTGGPGSIYSINNQNLMYFKLQGSVSPLSNLQTQIGTVAYFRTVTGPTSDSELTTDSEGDYTDGSYMGTELSLTVNYRPFSDLGVALSGGVFFPDGTLLDGNPEGLLSAYVSLSI